MDDLERQSQSSNGNSIGVHAVLGRAVSGDGALFMPALSTPGRQVQTYISTRLVARFWREYSALIDNELIPPGFLDSEHGEAALLELLARADTYPCDAFRFEAPKRVFFAMASDSLGDREHAFSGILVGIASRLEPVDLMLLHGESMVGREPGFPDLEGWLEFANPRSGLGSEALVLLAERRLVDLGVITYRPPGPDAPVTYEENGSRLTDLGRMLVEYLRVGEEIEADVAQYVDDADGQRSQA
ncbi:MAG: hypothetical protein DHS20C21_01870 [Gemmatimonadota bacterium]|nr:MAG: hypothetical protein DHS20C21_01870 [Gemmatimonadota bacterium]